MAESKITVLPPADPKESKRRGPTPDKIVFSVISVLLVLGLGGYLVGRKIWTEMRVRRARHLAEDAGNLVKNENYSEAQRAVRAAIQLAPNDPWVIRATATWCSLTSNPDGISYWDRLAQFTTLTEDDQLKKLDLALAINRLDISREILGVLLTNQPNSREVITRAIQHHSQTGDWEAASKAGHLALIKFPTDEQIQFQVGRLLLDIPQSSAQEEARRLLWTVALGNSAWSPAAVDQLVQKRQLNDGDRLLLIHSIEARKPTTLGAQLQVIQLRLAMVVNREPLWHQTGELVAKFPGLSNQVEIALWLINAGGTNQAQALVPREAASTNQMAAEATLEVLTRSQDWTGVRALIEQTPVALPKSAIEAARGVLAAAAGNASETAGYFASALQKAAGHGLELYHLSSYAEFAGNPGIAAMALIQAADLNPMTTVQFCRRALALVQPMDDLTIARRTMEKLVDYLPREPAVLIERSWLDLLLNEQVDRARSALNLFVEHPTLGQEARIALSLAELRQGEKSAALARLEALAVDPASLSPRSQAVYAAVLLANNQREPARRIAIQIPVARLRKKELELIASLL